MTPPPPAPNGPGTTPTRCPPRTARRQRRQAADDPPPIPQLTIPARRFAVGDRRPARQPSTVPERSADSVAGIGRRVAQASVPDRDTAPELGGRCPRPRRQHGAAFSALQWCQPPVNPKMAPRYPAKRCARAFMVRCASRALFRRAATARDIRRGADRSRRPSAWPTMRSGGAMRFRPCMRLARQCRYGDEWEIGFSSVRVGDLASWVTLGEFNSQRIHRLSNCPISIISWCILHCLRSDSSP